MNDHLDPPPEPPFTCLRCHDVIDEDDSDQYAGLCECCYDTATEESGEYGRQIINHLEQKLKLAYTLVPKHDKYRLYNIATGANTKE